MLWFMQSLILWFVQYGLWGDRELCQYLYIKALLSGRLFEFSSVYAISLIGACMYITCILFYAFIFPPFLAISISTFQNLPVFVYTSLSVYSVACHCNMQI